MKHDDNEKLQQLLDELSSAYDDALLAEAEEHLPEGFDDRMQKFIGQLEKPAKPSVILEAKHPSKGFPRFGFWRRYAAACVFAAAILSGSLGAFYMTQTSEPAFTDTCRTPQEAEFQMNRALAMINQKSRQGIEEAQEQIDRSRSIKPTKDYSKYFELSK